MFPPCMAGPFLCFALLANDLYQEALLPNLALVVFSLMKTYIFSKRGLKEEVSALCIAFEAFISGCNHEFVWLTTVYPLALSAYQIPPRLAHVRVRIIYITHKVCCLTMAIS